MAAPKRTRGYFAWMFECVTLGAHSVNTALEKEKLCYDDNCECDVNKDV